MRSHRVLYIGLLITALVIVGAGGLYWFVLKSPKLVVAPSPANAEVSVDGSTIHASKVEVAPGEHTVKVTSPDYVDYVKKVTLKRGQQLVLPVLLKPIPSPVVLSSDIATLPSFADGSNVYFLGNSGRTIYRTRHNSGQATVSIEPMTPDTLSDIQDIVWRSDAEAALLKRSDGIYFYDFQRRDLVNQSMTLWGKDIDQLAWSPSGIQVAYTYYGSNGEQTLIFADVQNKNIRRVANLAKEGIDHPSLQWSPDGQQLLLLARSPQKKTNYLYSLDIFTQKVTQLTEVGEVEGARWSPDGKHIAYVTVGKDSSGATANIVWVANADGSGVKPLNVPAESISKVGWVSNDALVVAVNNPGKDDQFTAVPLEGDSSAYQYRQPGAAFHPDHLLTIAGESRVLFFSNNQFLSLSLISSTYD